MLLNRLALLTTRSVALQAKRGAKITGPIVDTPAIVWKGKVYKKLTVPVWSISIIDFPWRYMLKKDWYMRYMAYTLVFVVLPVTTYMHRLVNSPANKAYWEAKRKADAEKEHKKEWDP